MSEDTVTIEVNGKPLQARKGAMLIEVTDEAGIKIPRFCYHKKLSVAANCRMCLVEVEKAPKPLPACATPVMDGMKVFTHSQQAIEAQCVSRVAIGPAQPVEPAQQVDRIGAAGEHRLGASAPHDARRDAVDRGCGSQWLECGASGSTMLSSRIS